MLPTVPQPSLQSRFLKPARLAWVMGVSTKTVERWLEDKEVSYFRMGHVIRIWPEAALDFILKRTFVARPGASPVAAGQPVTLDPKQFEVLCQRLDRLGQALAPSAPGGEPPEEKEVQAA